MIPMGVRYLYVKADGSLEGRRPHTAGCFGSILSNSKIYFGSNNPAVDLEGVTAIRVYNPREVNNNSPIPPFTNNQLAAMREMMESHPDVFEPVTLTPDYYEIRTDIPSDQLWFCMNNLRFAYRNEGYGDPYPQLKKILGVWKATMLYNGFLFGRRMGGNKFSVTDSFSDGSTAMWSGRHATASFVQDLLLEPMKLLGKRPPISELPGMSLYSHSYVGDYTDKNPFYMNTFLRVGHKGKTIRFPDVIAEMFLSDKELEELKTLIDF